MSEPISGGWQWARLRPARDTMTTGYWEIVRRGADLFGAVKTWVIGGALPVPDEQVLEWGPVIAERRVEASQESGGNG